MNSAIYSTDAIDSITSALKKKSCIITATRRGFSSTSKHQESEFNNYVFDDDDFKPILLPKFYANGDCEENEGYVSILFHVQAMLPRFLFSEGIETIQISITVTVIGATGDERFRQSFSYVLDVMSFDFPDDGLKFGLDRYLKRETLCNEPEELLPNDCLTVYLEVDSAVYLVEGHFPEGIISQEIVSTEGGRYVNLDSTFGRELRKVSDFFRSASDTPIKESQSRLVYVPNRDFTPLSDIYFVLKGAKTKFFYSIEHVCKMYTVADKYGIQSGVEASRQIMKSFLCNINDKTVVKHVDKNIPMLLQLAEKHGDESLKETISVYSEIKTKSAYEFEEHIKEKFETDWICQGDKFTGFFRLSRKRGNVPETGMEFYK